ncbi:uncharacterized protein At1g65710 isoform X2 [Amaranthus tricolor]|uniref:uncharacterized protein At1g65710 isoform X2 n=1 Tax=Amaranthus tricolor TaxID=29722 RepID=UPI0025865345|nr:uncharacterized protein At1g65710 isoform X2 [Amaranthus tricolor]
MGCCLSKNDPCSVSLTQQNNPKVEHTNTKYQIAAIETNPNPKEDYKIDKREEERNEGLLPNKKEVFVIHHRKSNDKRSDSDGSVSNSSNSGEAEEIGRNILAAAANGQVVRTSSCTKEEVDAILIQCGRLSRSSSGKGNGNGHGRRYSGSKRSFDFDKENEIVDDSKRKGNGNEGLIDGNCEDDERSRRRHSRGSHRRRTTPSRSRERENQQLTRSGSRERSQSNGRRVSRSPGRRSDSPMNHACNGNGNGRPAKLVSVPATVSSLTMEKAINGNGNENENGDGNGKRVLVKRNVASPRSQSPARALSPARARSPAKGGNGNGGGQQSAAISRNGSRKVEISPCRRTPLNEIDINTLQFHPLSNKKGVLKGKEIEDDIVVVKQPISSVSQNKYGDTNNGKLPTQGNHRRTGSRGAEGYEVTKTNYCRVNAAQTSDHTREQIEANECNAVVTSVVISGTSTEKLPQTLVRSRSARRSRDLDINAEALVTPYPATNYNSLLLQDIQNFHQKKSSNTNESGTPLTLPACVSKACSIVEAVADLNSATTNNNLRTPQESNLSFHNKRLESEDPFVESEVKVGDDLLEPSFHKYVTVRKRGDDEESSGSNSVGGNSHKNWASSSTWEPNSAESTDCWTSKSSTRQESSAVGFQKHAISDGVNDESEKRFSKGAARTRTISSRGTITTSKIVAGSM